VRSKPFIVAVIVIVLLVMSGCAGCVVRNGLVAAEEEVKSEWANVQSAYQRRADLVPNLVRTVERAETFDRGLVHSLESVQTRAGEMRLSPDDATNPALLAEYDALQTEVRTSLDNLLAVTNTSESLRSIEAFRDLQDQIEGSENRINVARRDYNGAVAAYNARIRRFPANVVASLSGLESRPHFQADDGAENPPRVD